MGGGRSLGRRLARVLERTGLARAHWLGRMFRGRDLRAREKGGTGVDNTRKGNGTKLMVLAERSGLPLGVCVDAASVAEATLAERTLAAVRVPRGGPGRPKQKPLRLIADHAYDGRALWERLQARGIDLIVPHRKNRKRPWQDGQKLRRYRRRWIIERTNAWLFAFRRLVTRYERHVLRYQAFVHVACTMIALRRF